MDKEYSNYARLEFRAKDGNAAVARLAAASCCAAAGFSMTEIAVIHGYHGDETRLVTMTLSVTGGDFFLEVADDGVGIADVEKALEPAYSTVEGRMGLGFVFMASFMDSLDVRSSPGAGTLVRMGKRCPVHDR